MPNRVGKVNVNVLKSPRQEALSQCPALYPSCCVVTVPTDDTPEDSWLQKGNNLNEELYVHQLEIMKMRRRVASSEAKVKELSRQVESLRKIIEEKLK